MRKSFAFSVVAFVVFALASMTSVAMADYTQTDVTAQYNLVNGYHVNNPSDVTPRDITVSVYNTSASGKLQYRDGGSVWKDMVTDPANSFMKKFTVAGVIEKQLIEFQLITGLVTSKIATLTFNSPRNDDPKSDLFRNVFLSFNNGSFYSIEMTSDPHYAQPVPVPAAIWLLGTGLIGLVGVRRRNRLQS